MFVEEKNSDRAPLKVPESKTAVYTEIKQCDLTTATQEVESICQGKIVARHEVTNSAQDRDCAPVFRDQVTNSAHDCLPVVRDEVINSAQDHSVPVVREEVTISAKDRIPVVRDEVANSAQNRDCVPKQDSTVIVIGGMESETTNREQDTDVPVFRNETTNSTQYRNCVPVARGEVVNSAQDRIPVVRDEVANFSTKTHSSGQRWGHQFSTKP